MEEILALLSSEGLQKSHASYAADYYNDGKIYRRLYGFGFSIGPLQKFYDLMLLAAAYVNFWINRLPGIPAVKGLLFSLIPFFMAQLLVMPMMGAGIFSINTPVLWGG